MEQKIFTGIAPVAIAGRLVGPGYKPFIIAEACINHEGRIELAEKMVYLAHAVGADAIKFQIHVLENEMLHESPQSDNFEEPLWETLERTNLSVKEHIRLRNLCDSLGILYMCTPFSRKGTDLLEEIGVDCYKTGSGELTNLPLIEHVAKKGKPMIVSTGMSEMDEVAETVKLVREIGTPLILTHCVSAYPAPYEIVNLNMIPRYSEMFNIPVGLSDHSRGIYTALGAVALGACLIEKHFTLDKTWKGPDHASSLEPQELAELVKGSDAIFKALGNERRIFPEETQIVAWARETVVTERPLLKGDIITEEMIWVKRPGPKPGAVAAKNYKDVIGRRVKKDIPKDTQVMWEDMEPA